MLLSVRKVVQKSTKLLSSQTRSLVRGDAFDVVTMGMMAEIHAAQTKTLELEQQNLQEAESERQQLTSIWKKW